MQTKARRPGRKPVAKRRPVLLLALCFAAAALAAALFFVWANRPLQFHGESAEFHVERGVTLRAAARLIKDAGVDLPENAFVLLAKVTAAESGIKAGSYEIHPGLSAIDLLRKLTRGDVSQAEVVIPEGWTFRQLRTRLAAHPDLARPAGELDEHGLMRMLGIASPSPEGWFFPDKYLFDKRTSELDLLARAHRMMLARLSAVWGQGVPPSPLKTPYELLILASIVEKETGRDSDRPLVAAVFVNRLRIGMPLQSDPTVIYGLGSGFDGNLRKRDLQTDSPYNTYLRAGLPLTPIAMPGEASLRAAMNPADTRALYFVARGDGSSEFSETLEAHNRAVNRYQRGGRS